jgi:transcriptional regulator of met regulon
MWHTIVIDVHHTIPLVNDHTLHIIRTMLKHVTHHATSEIIVENIKIANNSPQLCNAFTKAMPTPS